MCISTMWQTSGERVAPILLTEPHEPRWNMMVRRIERYIHIDVHIVWTVRATMWTW